MFTYERSSYASPSQRRTSNGTIVNFLSVLALIFDNQAPITGKFFIKEQTRNSWRKQKIVGITLTFEILLTENSYLSVDICGFGNFSVPFVAENPLYFQVTGIRSRLRRLIIALGETMGRLEEPKVFLENAILKFEGKINFEKRE